MCAAIMDTTLTYQSVVLFVNVPKKTLNGEWMTTTHNGMILQLLQLILPYFNVCSEVTRLCMQCRRVAGGHMPVISCSLYCTIHFCSVIQLGTLLWYLDSNLFSM